MLASPIEEIKNRLDIVEVIQGYIKLQKAGANYRALCPFHSEKKPSLFISPARQIWHCFGCSAGGDVFRFVMQIEGIEFGDALKILAQRSGVELKRQDPKLKTERQRFYEICELSTKFFEKQLEGSKTGQEIKNYLLNRGLDEESIKKWRIGYAPDLWQGLGDFLFSRGYKKEEAERAGLLIKNEEKRFYDRFRGRIIFPIFDLNSQVIGFGGRIFQEPKKKEENSEIIEAKYVNTPATLLYDKSRVLYGLDRAKVEIRKKDFCILVEGYIDAIMCSQAGFQNVVATSGIALTPFQLKTLKRYSGNVLTAFDMDIAGDTATKRGIDLAQSQGFNIKIITMPGKDPADVILEDPKNWEKLVSEARSIVDFYFTTTLTKFDKEKPEGKKEIAKIILPVIKRIPNKIEQSHWIAKLAKELSVKEEDIAEELKKVKIEQKDWFIEENTPFNLEKKSRKEMLEERLLALILKSPTLTSFIEEKELGLFSPKSKEIALNIKNNPNLNFQENFSPELSDFLNYLFLKTEVELNEEIDLGKETETCLREICLLGTKNKLEDAAQLIKKAEEERDWERVKSLAGEFNNLIRELDDLNCKYVKKEQKIKEN
jgi:DNA primase